MITRLFASAGLLLGLLLALAALQAAASPATAGEFVVTIDASPDSATNLVGSDHTVGALVLVDDAPGGADWLVAFNVTDGPNAGDSDSSTSDANGETSVTYTGDGGTGEDTIEVCVESQVGANVVIIIQDPLDCEEVTKTWVDPTPTPTPTPEPEPSATPTATPAEAAPAAELPDTGSQPPSGGEFPWLGALALSLVGATMVGGGWALSRSTR